MQQVLILQRNLFIAVIAALFALQAYLRFQSDIIPDAAWFIYVADQLLHGKTLYADIIEVNPPLGMWLVVPIVWVAEKFQIDAVFAVYAALLALSGATIWLCHRILKTHEGISPENSRLISAILALLILFYPATLFAEREHFMVVLFLPWLFLRIVSNNAARLNVIERLIIGFCAGLAICIKPQSVFAPLLVELIIYCRNRDLRSFISIENLGAMIFALIYLASIPLFAPKFLNDMVALGTRAYVPFYGYSKSIILLNAIWSVSAIIVTFIIRRQLVFLKADTRLLDGLLAAVFGFVVSYLIQMKGFGYQIMPADILASFASLVAAIKLWTIERKISWRILASLCVPIILLFLASQTYSSSYKTLDGIMARNAPQAKSLFIASTRIGDGFPYVQKRNFIWASRLPTQWLAPYVDANWHGGLLPKDDIVQKALDWTVIDLMDFKPDIIMIDVTTDQYYIQSGKFEYLKFWQNDRRFSAIWNDYKFRETVSGLDIYTLKNP